MLKYEITLEAIIQKTYEVEGVNLNDAYKEAVFLFASEPYALETYKIEVVDYKLIKTETETKAETYEQLRAYIQDITENQEPLNLLERLKP
jgi:hypothetical protein